MSGVNWIDYKGKRILSIDYRGTRTAQEMIAILHQAGQVASKAPGKICALTNFTDAFGSTEFMNEAKRFRKEQKTEKMGKSALLGIEGAKKVLLKGYLAIFGDNNVKLFNNEEDAKEWLIQTP